MVPPPQVTWNLDQDFMPVAKGQIWLRSSSEEFPELEPPLVNTVKVNIKSWEEQTAHEGSKNNNKQAEQMKASND